VRKTKLSVLFLTTLLAGVGATAGPAHAAAPTSTTTVLPFTQPSDVVSSGDRVFVSGGAAATQVVVTDAAGTITGTLDKLSGPTDLQLSNDHRILYVAQPGANSIVAFNTRTLRKVATYATGAGTCPATLAFTRGSIWFGYGCGGSWGGEIGRVDLSQSPAVVTTALAGNSFYGAPLLASAGRNATVLVAGEAGLSPWTGYAYTIGTDGTLTAAGTTNHSDTGSNLGDLALDPTGKTLYGAAGAPYHLQKFTVAGMLLEGGSFQTGPYPNAAEVSRDGSLIAGGTFAWYDPDVFVFRPDGTFVTSFELGGQDHVLTDGGLTWAPDGSTLYAISNDGYLYQNPGQLHVLPVPAV
jgi:hypothetical protein